MAKKKKNMLIQNSNLTGCLVSLSAKYCSPIQQQCEISTGIITGSPTHHKPGSCLLDNGESC